MTGASVYIYRVVLDTINGVSSTRKTSITAFSFKEGTVRQLQFVDDDTLMILHADNETAYLLNLPFQPASYLELSDKVEPPAVPLTYIDNDPHPITAKGTAQSTMLDISTLLDKTRIVIHAFATSGPKSNPIHIDVNGRQGRRAICVLYGNAMRYEVLDMDGVMEEEVYEEEGEEDEDEDEDEDFEG